MEIAVIQFNNGEMRVLCKFLKELMEHYESMGSKEFLLKKTPDEIDFLICIMQQVLRR